MAKNVLILSSSLRKGGNSDLLCDEFVKGVRESGHNAEKIFLKDKSINYCTGCGYCFERIGNCSQKDDMADIRDKMLSADVIVFATPVYFYTMAGQALPLSAASGSIVVSLKLTPTAFCFFFSRRLCSLIRLFSSLLLLASSLALL